MLYGWRKTGEGNPVRRIKIKFDVKFGKMVYDEHSMKWEKICMIMQGVGNQKHKEHM